MSQFVAQFVVIYYILFWIVRINGCFRRGRQPLLRGQDWFFDVHVQPGFYSGKGKKILHRFWMRMLLPFALDIPVAIAIFLSGRLELLNVLIVVLAIVIHVNHSWSVDLAERQARPFAIPEAEQPIASVALCLTPRKLSDYTNRKFEWAMAILTIAPLAWLARSYFMSPSLYSLRVLFGVPAFLLYLQVGTLLVKLLVVQWRSPLPHLQLAEHLEVREETRKYYLKLCDVNRTVITVGILFWPVRLSVSAAFADRLVGIWLATWLLVFVAGTVWVEIKRKQLVKLSLRARPAKLPDFLNQSEIAKWPVCYQPVAPMLILKGARGYSLNLANMFARLGAAYMVVGVVLFGLLRLAP